MPSPLKTISDLFSVFTESEFYMSILLTVLRAFISFAISFVFAFIFATLSYKYTYVRLFLYPFTLIARGTPTISVILICYLFIKPTLSTIIISSLVIFPLTYVEILSHYNTLDNNVLQAAKVYGVSNKKILLEYIAPQIFEKCFFTGASMLAFSIKLTISAEAILLTTNSIGKLMQTSKINVQTGRLFAYTIVAILLGLLLEGIAKLVKNILQKRRGL
jgi:NitT/TauT family transport system permease protein